MDDLYIVHSRGHMAIHMDKFFPTSLQNFKKLLKIIELDWYHQVELKDKMRSYFQVRIAEYDNIIALGLATKKQEKEKQRFIKYLSLL